MTHDWNTTLFVVTIHNLNHHGIAYDSRTPEQTPVTVVDAVQRAYDLAFESAIGRTDGDFTSTVEFAKANGLPAYQVDNTLYALEVHNDTRTA